MLYISLVRSHLTYHSQLWRPHFLKDIANLEQIQRRSTKYTLNDYTTNYKDRLITLNLLPLMYWYDLQDVMFLLKCLKDPDDNINIHRYITFTSSRTRATTHNQLKPNFNRTSTTQHFYFNRLARLWNKIPSNILDLSLSLTTLKTRLWQYLWASFITSFNPDRVCTFQLVCSCSNCIWQRHQLILSQLFNNL